METRQYVNREDSTFPADGIAGYGFLYESVVAGVYHVDKRSENPMRFLSGGGMDFGKENLFSSRRIHFDVM